MKNSRKWFILGLLTALKSWCIFPNLLDHGTHLCKKCIIGKYTSLVYIQRNTVLEKRGKIRLERNGAEEKFPERNLIGQKQGPRDATQGHGSDFQFYYCCITSECDVHVICHNYHHQQQRLMEGQYSLMTGFKWCRTTNTFLRV